MHGGQQGFLPRVSKPQVHGGVQAVQGVLVLVLQGQLGHQPEEGVHPLVA